MRNVFAYGVGVTRKTTARVHMLDGMCGRYTNTAGPEELNERFRVPIEGTAGTHRYNIAPTEEVLAIVAPKGEPEAELLRWGLVPSWANDLKSSAKMINARIETVTEKPAYKRLMAGSCAGLCRSPTATTSG